MFIQCQNEPHICSVYMYIYIYDVVTKWTSFIILWYNFFFVHLTAVLLWASLGFGHSQGIHRTQRSRSSRGVLAYLYWYPFLVVLRYFCVPRDAARFVSGGWSWRVRAPLASARAFHDNEKGEGRWCQKSETKREGENDDGDDYGDDNHGIIIT